MNTRRLFLLLMLLLISQLAFAITDESAGQMAESLMEPVTVVANFINSACIIIGGTFIFSGIIKYLQHRVNPLAVPIGTVVFMFIGGIVLLCLPLAYTLTGDTTPPYVQAQPPADTKTSTSTKTTTDSKTTSDSKTTTDTKTTKQQGK